MKQFLMFAAAVASLLLCSCTSELASEESLSGPTSGKQPLKIRATVDNATRADDIYSSSNLPTEFTVYAWKKGVEIIQSDSNIPPSSSDFENVCFIYNKKVILDGSTYKFEDGDIFWPENDAVDTEYCFFAFAGNGGVSHYITPFTWETGIYYSSGRDLKTTSTNPGNRDFIYAVGTVTKGNIINFNFFHSMSQIIFKSQIADSNWDVSFTGSVGVNGVRSSSTFHVAENTSKFSTEPSWGDPGYVNPATSSVSVDNAAEKISEGITMMALPTNMSAWSCNYYDTKVGSRIFVDCKITDKRNNKVLHNGKLYIPVSIDWKAGHKYTYTLVWGADGTGATDENGNPILSKIKMNVVTSTDFDFKEGTGAGDTNIPLE